MCVIAVKKQGVKVPEDEVLETCFKNNKDGAGFMYLGEDGEVFIRKGFMTWDEFKEVHDKHKFTDNDTVVYHFRIATTGSVSPENTHPFPISKDMKDLKTTEIETSVGITHNGIVAKYGDKKADISDTQDFVQKILSSNNFKKRIKSRKLKKVYGRISSITSSKFCILDDQGLILVGDGWITDKDSEMIFSNTSYKRYYPVKKYSTYDNYYDDEWWDNRYKHIKRGHHYYSESLRVKDLEEIMEDFIVEFFCHYEDMDNFDFAMKKAFEAVKDKLVPTDDAYNKITRKMNYLKQRYSR